jgi:hypothetical protein
MVFSKFTHKIAMQYTIVAFGYLHQLFQTDCENIIPFSLSYNICCLSKNTILAVRNMVVYDGQE